MTFKEWTAVVQLVGLVVIVGWLVLDGMGGGWGGTIAAVAMKLLWAVGALIAFNIVAIIVVTILVSIAQREVLKDEATDERDRLVAARAGRNAYALTSISAAFGLVALAFGVDPVLGAYMLFGAPVLGGATSAISELVYYRLG